MEINELASKVDILVKAFEQQNVELKEIKDALVGSAYTKGSGIVETQLEHEDRITKLESIRNADHEARLKTLEKYVVWFFATTGGMALVLGANVAKFITQLVTAYLTHK